MLKKGSKDPTKHPCDETRAGNEQSSGWPSWEYGDVPKKAFSMKAARYVSVPKTQSNPHNAPHFHRFSSTLTSAENPNGRHWQWQSERDGQLLLVQQFFRNHCAPFQVSLAGALGHSLSTGSPPPNVRHRRAPVPGISQDQPAYPPIWPVCRPPGPSLKNPARPGPVRSSGGDRSQPHNGFNQARHGNERTFFATPSVCSR